MKPTLLQTLRSRWFAGCVHVGAWLLLYLGASNLGGNAPTFRERDNFSTPPQSPVPVARLDSLFSPGIWPKTLIESNRPNCFLTTYFVPAPTPPAPPPPPPPPPPTTRKIELTYLGYYQTGLGPKQAIVKLADSFIISPLGAKVASNLFVAQVTMQTLTLTNPAAQTNLLLVNAKKEIEVPLK
jgi:hypothetical protein